jgi:hypothetical protein
MLLMSTVKEYEFMELFDFSKQMQQYYYSCRLEKQSETNSVWKCAKFANLPDAEKFVLETNSNTQLTRIIPHKCGNPFEYFENKVVYDKVNYPVEIIKFDNEKN